MKKRKIFTIFLFLLIILIFSLISVQVIKNTTRATQGIGMNITITAPPGLTLISPKNETYLNNQTILLNYSVSDEVWVKYSLDSGDNITLTFPVYFNASEGGHTLYLYANNSQGIRTRSVNFSVDSTLFSINSSEWEGDKKGNSTNFTTLSYQEIQNLSNLTIEHTTFGKILFNQRINMTNDINITDNEVNLDENINVSKNRIELNTTALPNFDKRATLWLYGLSFTNPRILIDGEACPSAICKNESYSGGILRFNVTGFTIYSADETPTNITTLTTTTVSGSGGGYGARLISPAKGFILSTEEIKLSVKQGQIITRDFIITNQENKDIKINIKGLKIEDLLLIEEQNFTLKSGESKTISFDIFAKEDTLPKLYLGKIMISSDSAKKELLVGIEVESKKPLFDVKVSIPERYKYIMPKQELFAEIEIYNLGEIEHEVDASIEYILMDFNGKEIYSDQETVALYTKINFLKSFKIPEDAPFGRYVLYIRTTYDGKIGSASTWFNVGKKPTIPLTEGTIAIAIILIISILIIIYKIRKIKKHLSVSYKVDKNALKRAIIKR